MATYQNVGFINSSNINYNDNNLQPSLTSSSRNLSDYSSSTYSQQVNSKSSTMPKDHYQNITTTARTKRNFILSENENYYLTPSDVASTKSSNETTKRMNSSNGKFSIQKMIRQGFSSWRTRKKLPPLSTPPAVSVSTKTSTPSSPSLSTGRDATTDNDLSQVHPSRNVHFTSVDLTANQTSPKPIIVTEQIAPSSSTRSNGVDFDGPSKNIQSYAQSSGTRSSTTNTDITESVSQPETVPTNRILQMQFAENRKGSAPLSVTSTSGSVPTMTETLNSTTPLTISSSNSSKLPPPGVYSSILIQIFS